MSDKKSEVENSVISAAFNAHEDLGDQMLGDKHLLSSQEKDGGPGTKILSKYEESEKNRENSFKDPMTGLLNRRGLLESYQLEKVTRQRMGGEGKVLLIGMDLIGLKKLNIELTAGGADEVVKNAAKHLKSSIRSSDLASRWGGDEFLLVLFGVSDEHAAETVGKINSNLPEHVHYNVGYKVVDVRSDPTEEISAIMNRMDEIKNLGEKDETGRSIGNGTVVDIAKIHNV